MSNEILILEKLTEIANRLDEQNLLKKSVINFNDACKYLDASPSHLYKLTSSRQIPHFCPQGKKLYFKREELDNWLQRNRQSTNEEIASIVDDELTKTKRSK
jgi:excisionase family DNA binding protein